MNRFHDRLEHLAADADVLRPDVDALRDRARRRTIRRRAGSVVAAAVVALAFVLPLNALLGAVDYRVSRSAADESSRQLSPGLPSAPLRFGSAWSPDIAPFGTAQDSLAEAESDLGYKLYTPDTTAASDASLIHAWVGTEDPGGEDMLPTEPQATVALAYSSGIQVTYVPWVYGVKVPAFSQGSAAESYKIAASQDDSYSTATVAGVPVLLTAYDKQAGPGSVAFNLGSSNEDAQTIAVIGKLSAPELEDVARSIIQQWSADHPDAAFGARPRS